MQHVQYLSSQMKLYDQGFINSRLANQRAELTIHAY
jgi:hypothetical protein